jgi:ABC-type polysaccharide/polyol phosphate export permease
MPSNNFAGALADLRRAIQLRHVWFFQAYHSITSKYRRSILGPFLLAGSMVATSLALSLVFGGIFGQSLHDTLPFIMSGIVSFNFLSQPIGEGPETFVAYGGMIKSNNFPFMYYVFESVSKNFITFLHNLLIYFILMIAIGAYSGVHWSFLLALPLIFLFLVIYMPLVGLLGARYRDIRFLLPYLGQLIFFITPIFWRPSALHGMRANLVTYNPFYHLLQVLRQPLLGSPATMGDWLGSLVTVGVGLLAWLFFFGLHRRRIPFWV